MPSTLDCISCGLCIPTCPTWQQTGRESQSPRGRVRMMRAHNEGRLPMDAVYAQEMEDCLVCRHCESVCPAGVSFGALMEDTRESLTQGGFRPTRKARMLLAQILRPKALHLGMSLLRFTQRLGLAKHLGNLSANMPAVPSRKDRRPLPDFAAANPPRRGEVWLLEGCVMPELYGRVNRATVKILQRIGYDVRIPKPRLCCGALHAHAGDGDQARTLARDWLAIAKEVGMPDAILSASAGCGAHMAEFDRILAADPEWLPLASSFSALVQDVSAFLGRPENLALLKPRLHPLPVSWLPLAYDDPCHLCHGQQVRDEPRALLDAIPQMHRVDLELAESCCGSAGMHSMLSPEAGQAQLAPKLVDLEMSGAATLVTANPGCHMQWETGQRSNASPKSVRHLMEMIERALHE